VTEKQEFDFSRLANAAIFIPTPTQTTTYGVGPVVGLDTRLKLTDHVLLVPGVRLHNIRDNASS
jgi:hypothetical protein